MITTPLIVQFDFSNRVPPRVYLSKGTWLIKSDHKTSELRLVFDGGNKSIPLEGDVKVVGDDIFWVKAEKVNEHNISIEAQLCPSQ